VEQAAAENGDALVLKQMIRELVATLHGKRGTGLL
jgi:hypothetical protein